MNPKVGIIISNFNYDQYVGEAITSCLKQTYPDIILSCIDDGSTDDSWEIIKNTMFPNKTVKGNNTRDLSLVTDLNENRFAIKNHKCAGTSIGRNLLIKHLWDKVDYFLIHDSDDVMYPTKVERLVKTAQLHPAIGCVYADYDIFNVKTELLQREFKEPFDIFRLEQECIVSSGALFSKQAAESVLEDGQCFDPLLHGPATETFIGSSEDYDFWLRIAEKWVIVHVPKALSMHRVHGRNESMPEKVTNEVWQKNYQRILSKRQQRFR